MDIDDDEEFEGSQQNALALVPRPQEGDDDAAGADDTSEDRAGTESIQTTGDNVAAPAIVRPGPNREQVAKLTRWADPRETPNIAVELEQEELDKIGRRAHEEYDIDFRTLGDWRTKSQAAIKLANQVAEKKMTPWPGASNVIFPLMTAAAIQFQARAYPAIVAGRNVVKGVVVGSDDGKPVLADDGSPRVMEDPQNGGPLIVNGQPQIMWEIPPGAKQARADRIGGHMSWQLLEEMDEWEEETDKLLLILPIVGCAFRKTYFDPGVGCNTSVLALAQNMVVNYHAKSLERASRISEDQKIHPIEIQENMLAKVWSPYDFGKAQGSENDADAAHDFVEQHRRLDLDNDGYAEPYVVTYHKQTRRVVRIVARYDADGVMFSQVDHTVRRIKAVNYYTQYNFLPNIDGGLYGMGFGQLLSPINASVNTLINELIDSGHLANTQGGFIGKGLSMHSGSVKFKKGEFKPVNVPGAAIRDAIVPMQFKEPSSVLFQLLGLMVEAGKEISSVQDVLTGDVNAATMQPTTLLALIEQGLKVFTGIYKRIYRAEKKELEKLYRLNRVYMDMEASYSVGDEWHTITRDDYEKGSGVIPISDPAMVSDMQKAARAQFLQGYQNDPEMDGREIRKRVFAAAGIEDVDKLFRKMMGPPPQLVFEQQRLTNETIKTRAAAIKDLALAQKALADADATVGETAMAMIRHNFDLLQAEMASLPTLKPEEETQPGAQPSPQGAGAPSAATAAIPQPSAA